MAVECPKYLFLPYGAQLVERKTGRRNSFTLPAGLRFGQMSDLPPGSNLPPGVDLVYLPRRYFLPQCISIPSLSALPSTMSLCPGDVVCKGVKVVYHPNAVKVPPRTEIVEFDGVAYLLPGMELMDRADIEGFSDVPESYEASTLPLNTPHIRERLLAKVESDEDKNKLPGLESTGKLKKGESSEVDGKKQLLIHVLMRIQPGMYPDPRLRDRGQIEVVSESKQSMQERDLLERNNAVLRREVRDLQRRLARVTASMEEHKTRANKAEEAHRKSDTAWRDAKSDYDILKASSTQAEASLRSRLADMEANKNRRFNSSGATLEVCSGGVNRGTSSRSPSAGQRKAPWGSSRSDSADVPRGS